MKIVYRALHALVALVALAIVSGAAFAQSPAGELKLQEPSAFVEGYLEKPAGGMRGHAVGASIVGVRLDGPVAPFDPANIRVRLGGAAAAPGEKLCLKVISRDGRYFARAQYGAAAAGNPAPRVEFKTAYQSVLAGYSNRDIAAAAFRNKDCNAQSGLQFVVSEFTPGPATALLVQVRAGEARVRAQLAQGSTPVGDPVLCTGYESGTTVGFGLQCAIKLPTGLKSGQFQLMIGETTSGGDIKVKTYPLSLWIDG